MFTQNWSNHIESSIRTVYPELPTGPVTSVEIGCFEGRGTQIIAKLLGTHPESRIYCIDPWEDCYTTNVPQFKDLDPLFQGQFARFKHNTKDISGLIPLQGTSEAMIGQIAHPVDFVYIDGDHSPDGVYLDGTLMLEKMKIGGFMVFDDYEWTHNGLRCRDGVDRFLRDFAGRVEVVKKAYQVMVRVVG